MDSYENMYYGIIVINVRFKCVSVDTFDDCVKIEEASTKPAAATI